LEQHFIVASGIEFKDVADHVALSSGLLFLCHRIDDAKFDKISRFTFIEKSAILGLSDENIYSWGDFCWVDYNCDNFPEISNQEIAELLYFGHKAEPFDKIQTPSLNNRYLFYAHDDGWFTKIYYKNWNDIDVLIRSLAFTFDKDQVLESIIKSKVAFWIYGDSFEVEEATFWGQWGQSLNLDKLRDQ